MRLTIVAIFAFSLTAGSAAGAFDLTGNWVGSWSCTEFDLGTKTKDGEPESTLAVTSLGNGTFRGIIDNNYSIRGIEIADIAKPEKGEIAWAHCGTSDDLAENNDSELGRWKVSTTAEGRGTISGTSVWSLGFGHVATCKYKYTRQNLANPNLTYPCP